MIYEMQSKYLLLKKRELIVIVIWFTLCSLCLLDDVCHYVAWLNLKSHIGNTTVCDVIARHNNWSFILSYMNWRWSFDLSFRLAKPDLYIPSGFRDGWNSRRVQKKLELQLDGFSLHLCSCGGLTWPAEHEPSEPYLPNELKLEMFHGHAGLSECNLRLNIHRDAVHSHSWNGFCLQAIRGWKTIVSIYL